MGSIFWKRFQVCRSKLKCFSTNFSTSSSSRQDHEYHRQYPSSPTLISTISDDFFSSSDSDSPPDLSAVFASQRFFFSAPGHSNSILQSPEPLLQTFFDYPPLAGCVAVHTETPDPYRDFRQSMLEMVEARRLTDVKAKLRYLHELLFCYLTLNPKSAHKFIASAFSDLVISLMSADGRRRSDVRQRLLM